MAGAINKHLIFVMYMKPPRNYISVIITISIVRKRMMNV
jgi:hypothetical protein